MAAGTGITCFVNGDKRDASLAAIQQGGGIGPDPLDVTTGKSCGINLTFLAGYVPSLLAGVDQSSSQEAEK